MRTQPAIPNKLYFRIGEVADLLSVKPYVLRYWETEFSDIKPSKSKSGQRLYKRRDVELLVRIRELLYQERFTINGARKRLKELVREHRGYETNHPQIPLAIQQESMEISKTTAPPVQPSLDHKKVLTKIKKDLETILEALKS